LHRLHLSERWLCSINCNCHYETPIILSLLLICAISPCLAQDQTIQGDNKTYFLLGTNLGGYSIGSSSFNGQKSNFHGYFTTFEPFAGYFFTNKICLGLYFGNTGGIGDVGSEDAGINSNVLFRYYVLTGYSRPVDIFLQLMAGYGIKNTTISSAPNQPTTTDNNNEVNGSGIIGFSFKLNKHVNANLGLGYTAGASFSNETTPGFNRDAHKSWEEFANVGIECKI
jgi:hypothetical protein